MKTLLRAAAIAVASTALVAGGSTVATAAPGDTASISVPDTALNGFKGTTSKVIPVTLASNLRAVYATVTVNGVVVDNNAFVGQTGFTYQQAWGPGVVTLTDLRDRSRISGGGNPGREVAGASNAFTVRYGVDLSSQIRVTKRGKKLTFKVKAKYIDNRGKSVGIRKATIQVKKSGKWKTLKNVSLKKNGTRTYKTSSSKKRNYRLLIKTTSTYAGGNSTGTRKI